MVEIQYRMNQMGEEMSSDYNAIMVASVVRTNFKAG